MRKKLLCCVLLSVSLVLVPSSTSGMARANHSMMQLPACNSDNEEDFDDESMADIVLESDDTSSAGGSSTKVYGCDQCPPQPMSVCYPTEEDRAMAEAALFSNERCQVLCDLLRSLQLKCIGNDATGVGQALLGFIEIAEREHYFLTKCVSMSNVSDLKNTVARTAPAGKAPDAKKHELAKTRLKKARDCQEHEAIFLRRLGRVKDNCRVGNGGRCERYVEFLTALYRCVEELMQLNNNVINALKRRPRDEDELMQACNDAARYDGRIFGEKQQLSKKRTPREVILRALVNAEARS